MTPSAIYSKSGKGVQEASGKTSLLSRSDRAVLSAFDGRITVKEVAERVGKPFDGQFEKIIRQLERDGFVREVVPGNAATAPGRPGQAAPAQGKPPASDELDFTAAIPASPRPAAPPPDLAAKARAEAERKAKEEQANSYKVRQEAEAKKQAEAKAAEARAAALAKAAAKAAPKPPPEDEARAEAARKLNLELPVFSKPAAFDADATARMQAAAFAKAREEAEEKAQKERERLKAEAEAKLRVETEAKMRAEAEAQEAERAEYARMAQDDAKKKEAEAKVQAAREAALRAAFEAERAHAKEEAERARKEQERLARLEAERKAKEEQERKARDEHERKAREEAERKAKEEQARRAREEAERQAKQQAERQARDEQERKAREDQERIRAEEERSAKEQAARAAREAEQALKEVEQAQKEAKQEAKPEAKDEKPSPVPVAVTSDSFADSLLADLDSFTQREDEAVKANEEAIRKEKDEVARKASAKAEVERKARDDAERQKREEEEGRRQEEEARRAREEQERAAREAGERASREAEERRRVEREALMEKEAAALAKAGADDIVVTDDDLDMDDVKQDEAAISKEAREREKKAVKEREREAKEREREAKERAKERKREAKRAAAAPPPAAGTAYAPIRRRRSWGKPVTITLLVLLAAGIALLHVIPIATDEYEKAASEATGRPVKIASAHLSLYNGLLLKLDGVSIGDVRIASLRAYPALGSLMDDKKAFTHIDMDGVSLPQARIGEVLGANVKSDRFSVARVNARRLKLVGVLEFPELEADLRLDRNGSVRSADLRGADGLAAKLTPKGANVEFDVTANSFTLPIAPEITLTGFAMKGVATPESMRIDSWGGGNLDGAVSGNATVRWGSNWNIDGALTVRGINGAVFAPALLSEGKVEGNGRFSVNGPDPKRFMERGRLEGSFTVHKGVLGSVDLSRAIQTGGRQAEGRTPFTGLSAQGLFDKGAISLRNVAFNAGALNAGASADIASNGALSGRIIADIRTSSQTLRATVNLGGTVKEPQVKN